MIEMLIPPQFRLLAMIVAAIALLVVGFGAGWKVRDWQADAAMADVLKDYAEKREKAISAAREDERKKQEYVNDTLRQQAAKLSDLNKSLSADLERLRTRPPRSAPGVPANPGTHCPPATGAELSRQDAEFLVREAGRADELRVALEACYRYADGLM